MTAPISPSGGVARIHSSAFERDRLAAFNQQPARQSASGETIELSHSAQALQHASACQCARPVVDQSRIERLREAIENGHYTIDSQRLAGKLLAFERDL